MSKDEYLITDAPLKALTVFAMPMILGSFFQQVYNMADSIIVGQYVGSSALAAVGACAALTNVFICVALGAGIGAGVLVSRYFGARDYSKMKTIVSTSLISFMILSILLGVFGLIFSRSMMTLLQTPADILDEAVLYLRVYFAGFPFLFMYNILSTMFTSIGESKIPLALLIFSSMLNILMDLWMVAGLGLGVFGAALATLIAQGISAVLSLLIFLCRMRRYESRFDWFDRQELHSMLQIAVPSVLQQSTVSIGMMIVQAVVNPFGTQALAGYSATMRPPATTASGCASKNSTYARINPALIRSSSSMKATSGACASRSPRLRAYDTPGPSSATSRRLHPGCAAAKAAKRASVSSVELLLTTTHSHSPAGMSCRTTDSSAATSCAARLWVGMTSEIRIIVRM